MKGLVIIMDNQKLTTKQKVRKFTGNFATIACLVMYFSYIEQIIANFTGQPVSPVQPFFASINALLWVIYGWIKPDKKDWPVIIANFPGIIFGLVTAITSFVH